VSLLVIDKCDVRVPKGVPFTRDFGKLYPELRNAEKSPFRSSSYYLARGDLRKSGHEAILHVSCKYGDHDHKIELVDAGLHCFQFLVNEVERIFDINPLKLDLMRVDFAADVPGVNVPWFLGRVRAKYKRFHNAGTSAFDYQQLGQKGIQTIYLGKRPNFIRIYDKVAEWQYQYTREEKRAQRSDAEIPSFETKYGISGDSVLTRVERQIGGKIPEQIALPEKNATITTMGDLRLHAADFDPFSKLLLAQGKHAPQPSNFHDVNQYLAVLHARELVSEMGMHAFYQWLNVQTNRNAWRWWNKYGEWVCDSPGITVPEIRERYRDSVSRQLLA
jgi:hypothetical protein